MTCREKLKLEHPECIDPTCAGGCQRCPHTYGYTPIASDHFCRTTSCNDCWDRELPEARPIKDSGDRTEFETGAVRDMREGKGRCDLMPLEVVAEIVCEKLGHDPILYDISCFLDKDDEQGTAWLKAALDNFADKAYDGQRTTMFLEVAKHFEEGAKKYGENNWQKGIPVKCYIDSAVRHYLKWLRGDKDEPHDRAFVWNLMCCIWEVDYREKE